MILELAGIARRDMPGGWTAPETVPLLVDFDTRSPIAVAHLTRQGNELHAEATIRDPDRATVARVMSRRLFAVQAEILVTGWGIATVRAVSLAERNVDPEVPRYSLTVDEWTREDLEFLLPLAPRVPPLVFDLDSPDWTVVSDSVVSRDGTPFGMLLRYDGASRCGHGH